MPQDTLFKSERIVDDSSTLRAEDFVKIHINVGIGLWELVSQS